jgi:hypothetical protein
LVLTAHNVREVRTLEELTNLETLTLNIPGRPRLDLEFEAFPALKRLRLYWNAGFERSSPAQALRSCGCSARRTWISRDLRRSTPYAGLNSAKVGNSSGQPALSSSTGSRFWGCTVNTASGPLTGVGKLSSLLDLSLEKCKNLESIDEVSALTSLRTLKLVDCGGIPSLQPLTNLSNLERFFAWGSTRIAYGDQSVLMRLPRLHEIAMQSRRAYRPSVDEVELALSPAQRTSDSQ